MQRQIDAVYDYMDNHKNGLRGLWDLLPRGNDLSFADNEYNNRLTERYYKSKLFLGGDGQSEIWAYLGQAVKGTREVKIFVEKEDNSGRIPVQSVQEVIENDWEQYRFSYPFEALRLRGNPYSRDELDAVIRLYFLDAGEIEEVWHAPGQRGLKPLRLGIIHMADAYKRFPGGPQAVPEPRPLPPRLTAIIREREAAHSKGASYTQSPTPPPPSRHHNTWDETGSVRIASSSCSDPVTSGVEENLHRQAEPSNSSAGPSQAPVHEKGEGPRGQKRKASEMFERFETLQKQLKAHDEKVAENRRLWAKYEQRLAEVRGELLAEMKELSEAMLGENKTS